MDKTSKLHEMTEQQVIDNLFNLIETICTKHCPSEDRCHQLLNDLLTAAKLINDPVSADHFEGRWKETKKKIKTYADPFTFRRHEIEIALVLKKILAPARMEL